MGSVRIVKTITTIRTTQPANNIYTMVEKGSVLPKTEPRPPTRTARSGNECINHEATAPPTLTVMVMLNTVDNQDFEFCMEMLMKQTSVLTIGMCLLMHIPF